MEASNFARYRGLLCVHFQETSLLESFICKSDNSMEKIKGGGKTSFECKTVGVVFGYGQVLLLLMCPVLLRCDGVKPECWQRPTICGTNLN